MNQNRSLSEIMKEEEAENILENQDDESLSWGQLLTYLKTLSVSELNQTVSICDDGGHDVFGRKISKDKQGHMYIDGF
jgi:hypothetical protein